MISRFILIIIFNFISLHSAFSSSRICGEVTKWEEGIHVPPAVEYEQQNIALPVSATEAYRLQVQEKWTLLDVRGKYGHRAGIIPKAIRVEATAKYPKFNELTEKKLLRAFKRHFKKERTKVSNFSDLKKLDIIIFCNGFTCHRSTFAACWLRKNGFEYNKLRIMLGGYPQWRDSYLPMR